MRLVSIGEVTIDRYVDRHASFVGGIALNFAVHAKRSGAKLVSLISRVGEDDRARRVRELLDAEDIDCSFLLTKPGRTASIEIALDQEGERSYPRGGFRRNVLASFQITRAERDFILGHDVLVTQLDRSAGRTLFDDVMLVPFEGRRVVDFGDISDYAGDIAQLLVDMSLVDIAFISGSQQAVDSVRPISMRTDSLIVVTMGAEGSVAIQQGVQIWQPAETVDHPVDSTGCGDAFQAAFVVSYCQDGDIVKAMKRGAVRAARVLQTVGACPAIL